MNDFRYLKVVHLILDVKNYLRSNNSNLFLKMNVYSEIREVERSFDNSNFENVIESEKKILNILIKNNLLEISREYKINMLNF